MPEVRIRSAEHRDAEWLARLSGELGYAAAATAVAERIVELLARSDHAVLVAVAEGSVLGWVHVFLARRLESSAFAELGGLVVTEKARGRGIGRGLVAAAERWARQQGVDTMRVRSNVVRAQAHAFYRHLGYQTIKEQAVFRKALARSGGFDAEPAERSADSA